MEEVILNLLQNAKDAVSEKNLLTQKDLFFFVPKKYLILLYFFVLTTDAESDDIVNTILIRSSHIKQMEPTGTCFFQKIIEDYGGTLIATFPMKPKLFSL